MPYAKGTVEICMLQRSIYVCSEEYIRVLIKEEDY